MVHELSHALVAILTGGQVLGIAIRLDGSGVTYARGGNLVLTASAGYVGSSVFGAVLWLAARGPEWLVALFVYLLAVLNGLYAVSDLLTLLEISGPAVAAASDAATLQR